jgi:hypothetical protein
MDEWEAEHELSDELNDDAMRERLADEERTRDEDAIQQDEHPIDMDTEEPDKKKILKRILEQQALIRLETAARTKEDFENLIQWWDRLDENRERRERYHEVLRNGEEFPLEYGASPDSLTFPGNLNCVLEKQIQRGDFLDVIFNCPLEIHELVSDSTLSKILAGLNDEQKELLYLCGVQYLSAAKVAAIQGKTDRNIRKVRFTLIRKINAQLSELLGMEDKRKDNPAQKPTRHEEYLLKKLDMKREKRQKKGKKKRRPDKGDAK